MLSNPPFSLNYDAELVGLADDKHGQRMKWGATPENGKKADLMFVQHMVSVLEERGIAATVMPHGVLFRSGKERDIRVKLLEDDCIEAVIGLGPNLFYGTAIPGCILVLRPPHRKRGNREKNVLFINADRDFRAARNQNELDPEHVEKIATVFREWRQEPGYSRAVSIEDLLAADANLSIRRWVDSSPPAEPQDVRAHLYGGVPKSEIEAKAKLFEAYGVYVSSFFSVRDSDPEYMDFLPEGPQTLAARVPELAAPKEAKLRERYEKWWNDHTDRFSALADDHRLMDLRARLVSSFTEAVGAVGVLDEYTTAGIMADWWTVTRYDLKALAAGGYERVLDGWVDSVETMVEPLVPDTDEPSIGSGPGRGKGRTKSSVSAADRRRAMDQPVVRVLIPGFLAEVAHADEVYATADAAYKTAVEELAAAQPATPGMDEDAEDDSEERAAVAPEEVARLETVVTRCRKERTAAAKKRSALDARFLSELHSAAAMAKKAESAVQSAVLPVLNEALWTRLDAEVGAGRQEIVASVLRWADKYTVSLEELEAKSATTAGDFGAWLALVNGLDEWPFQLLESVATVTAGVTLGSEPDGGGVIELPYLRVANVLDGRIDTTDVKTVRIMRSQLDRYAIHAGDLLITEGGDLDKLGRGAVWDGRISPCLHQNHVFRVRCNDALSSEFLELYMSSPMGRSYFQSVGKQTTNLASINLTQVKNMPIPIPSQDEQERILGSMRTIRARIAILDEQIEKLKAVRNGMVESLMAG